eukprot:TRINITY_DN10017_c0_g1_i3.p1 TRINITY_DN10017_c0_g1~~TRINITY_DN10017_c0_g1_i3.p1  ORF type:complete len:262 (+),score=31.14 TRINITY_DN10017_c0_g1_i3:197-982(+)
MNPLVVALYETPPITRLYAGACLLTTLATMLDVVSPYQLYYYPKAVFQDGEVWRLVTTFVFFGPLSLNWIFHMFFLVRYCRMLEDNSFRGRTADMAYMILLGAAFLLLISPWLTFTDQLLFLGSSLTFMLVYVWSRRNPSIRMGLLALFFFRAPYLPWVLLGLGVLLNHDPWSDLLGIAAGHLYYFLEDVYAQPRAVGGLGGPQVLATPRWLKYLIEGQEAPPAPADARPAGGFNWGAPVVQDARQDGQPPAPAEQHEHQD